MGEEGLGGGAWDSVVWELEGALRRRGWEEGEGWMVRRRDEGRGCVPASVMAKGTVSLKWREGGR